VSEAADDRPGCGPRLEIVALPGIPIVQPGDDLAALIGAALGRAELMIQDGDVLVVASKLVSRAEGRFVDLSTVEPSPRAHEVAAVVGKDPRHVELVLRESAAVSRMIRNVLIVRHRLGFVVANAGIDLSNAAPVNATGTGPWAILLPSDPDGAAARLRGALGGAGALGVIISDSFGRPFRLGTVGAAIGVAGVPALWDQRGDVDLFGRPLENTITALADQLAAAADLVAGQAAEGRGAVLIRGLRLPADVAGTGAGVLLRAPGEDLYA
jgi:coenzyme F420-0:L-glutamate ligase / coenzyme F420-1:gamma-L-glutamate ligase